MTAPGSTVGTFLAIPLPDGTFGYARALGDHLFAFYDYRTSEPVSDLDTVETKPVRFSLAVRRRRGGDSWRGIGRRPLTGEVGQPVVQYMQDLMDFRKCVLFDTAGMRREVGPQECVGVEQSAVWEPHHVEQRLLDAFEGRPNEDEIRSRVRLS